MFRRNPFRIINKQLHNSLNISKFNSSMHNNYYQRSIHTFPSFSGLLDSKIQERANNDVVNLLLRSLDTNAENKINGLLNQCQSNLYQKYFEALVSKCEEDGNIHKLFDDTTKELIGCVLLIPFSHQSFNSTHWISFRKELKSNGLSHIVEEMHNIENHFNNQIIDIADRNSYEEQFDLHVLEWIALDHKYQGQGYGTQFLQKIAEEYKNDDSAIIFNTCNERISKWYKKKLAFKFEDCSEYQSKQIKWYSMPPILHNYWNY